MQNLPKESSEFRKTAREYCEQNLVLSCASSQLFLCLFDHMIFHDMVCLCMIPHTRHDPTLQDLIFCCFWSVPFLRQKHKMKPTNPNAHTYDEEPRNQSYERRERKSKVWSGRCGVLSVEYKVYSVECKVWSFKC